MNALNNTLPQQSRAEEISANQSNLSPARIKQQPSSREEKETSFRKATGFSKSKQHESDSTDASTEHAVREASSASSQSVAIKTLQAILGQGAESTTDLNDERSAQPLEQATSRPTDAAVGFFQASSATTPRSSAAHLASTALTDSRLISADGQSASKDVDSLHLANKQVAATTRAHTESAQTETGTHRLSALLPVSSTLENSLSTLHTTPATPDLALAATSSSQHKGIDASSVLVDKPSWSTVRLDPNQAKWGEQMLNVLQDRVTLQANQNIQEARIRLDPPDLGGLELRVKVEGDRLSVQITANHAQTRDALIQVSERLRHELQLAQFVHVDVNIAQGDKGQDAPTAEQSEDELFQAGVKDNDLPDDTTPLLSEHWLNTSA